MIIKLFKLICDVCSKEYHEYFDEIEDISVYPKEHGWTERKVKNGSIWNFCPKCSKLSYKEIP